MPHDYPRSARKGAVTIVGSVNSVSSINDKKKKQFAQLQTTSNTSTKVVASIFICRHHTNYFVSYCFV